MGIRIRLALIGALLSPTVIRAEDLLIITHELKPLIWSDKQGHLQGSAYDMVAAILARLGDAPADIRVYPFARALRTAETRDSVAVFPVARTSEREHRFKWVGPISTSGVYFYTLMTNTVPLTRLEDAKALKRIGVGNGNATMSELEKAGFTNLTPINDEEMVVKMLLSGRIDAAPVSELVMNSVIKENHFDEKLIVKTNLKLIDVNLYIAFSVSTPDEVIVTWQAAFDAITGR